MRKEWKYNGEVIEKEPWAWVAEYADGTFLKQFDDDGVFHRVGEIDQDRLRAVHLEKNEKKITILWQAGMKLVHKYRHYVFDVGTPYEIKVKVYIFGYKYNGQRFFSFIKPDDTVIYSLNDQLT